MLTHEELWKSLGLPPLDWRPSPSFNAGREAPLDRIIVHVTEGAYEASVGWLIRKLDLDHEDEGTSAHYVVNEAGSKIAGLVKDEDTAWHAGNWNYNSRAIGVEHSGFSGPGEFSDGLYKTGAYLVAYLCFIHNIPPDRQHIIGHVEVPNQVAPAHWDPGTRWDWSRYMGYVKEAYLKLNTNPGPPEVVMLNGHALGHGFLDFWNQHDGLFSYGLPISEEMDYIYPDGKKKTTIQAFEGGVLEYDPAEKDPAWRVRRLLIGQDWLDRHGLGTLVKANPRFDGPIKAFWEKHGGVVSFGLPITDPVDYNPAHVTTGTTIQGFEGVVLEFDFREPSQDWKVRRLLIGQDWLDNSYKKPQAPARVGPDKA